ncbi:MAG: hypothetical protein ACI3YT_01000 [Prevotella sp.]
MIYKKLSANILLFLYIGANSVTIHFRELKEFRELNGVKDNSF